MNSERVKIMKPPMKFSRDDYYNLKINYSGMLSVDSDTELEREKLKKLKRSSSLKPFRFEVSPLLPKYRLFERPKSAIIKRRNSIIDSPIFDRESTILGEIRIIKNLLKSEKNDCEKTINNVIKRLDRLENYLNINNRHYV